MRALTGILVLWASVAAADINETDNHKNVMVDCKKDPNVTLLGNQNNYMLHGACTTLQVQGNHNTVKAETVTTIKVDGNDNTIVAAATDNISTRGSRNTVSYKAPASSGKDKPGITNPGTGNTINRAK